MKNTEAYFLFKKYDVFCQSWLADQNSHHHLLIVHGLGEHSSSYTHMAKYLCEHGISSHGFDLIGHGQSSGQRGYVPTFDLFIEQLAFVYQMLKNNHSTDKISIFSHSMGGLITLKALVENVFSPETPLIFSNPLVDINVDIPQWKINLANGLAQVLPRLALGNEINNNDLTKDPEVIASYSQDPLRHKKISTKLYMELKDNTELVRAKIENIQNPTLFLISPNDKVCNADTTQALTKEFVNMNLELFPQSGHEIINDFSKLKAFDDIIEFIKRNG